VSDTAVRKAIKAGRITTEPDTHFQLAEACMCTFFRAT
jgi:hypothetical protein